MEQKTNSSVYTFKEDIPYFMGGCDNVIASPLGTLVKQEPRGTNGWWILHWVSVPNHPIEKISAHLMTDIPELCLKEDGELYYNYGKVLCPCYTALGLQQIMLMYQKKLLKKGGDLTMACKTPMKKEVKKPAKPGKKK